MFRAGILIGLLLAWCPLNTITPARADTLGDNLGFSPYWNWKTIETDHFRVTFPEDIEVLAQRAANYLEEAHRILSPRLYWEPHTRTQIVVVDNSDAANGLTSAVLRFGLVLMVTPPEGWFSTAYYDDWLRLLCIHEYTHLLNMDATHDFYVPARYLLGDLALPNSIWPSWMLEGLAVYMETRYTRSGRGRSSFYEMLLRSSVEDGVLGTPDFITLDKINGTSPYFPSGEVPYLFGYQLMNELTRHQIPAGGEPTFDGKGTLKDNEDVLGVMSDRSSGRVPFFINSNLQNITGLSWYDHWELWVAETRARMKVQLEKIKSQPVTPVERLTKDGFQVLGSAPSPDGHWIAYTQDSTDDRMGVFLRDLQTGAVRKLADKLYGGSMAFSPDSRFLYLSGLRRSGKYYLFSELGVYNLERRTLEWLTDRLRARDPDVSRDGKRLVFTITEAGTTGLATAELDLKDGRPSLEKVEKFYLPPRYDRVATPKFSWDGKQVYFSWHRNGHFSEELAVIDLPEGEVHEAKPAILVENGKFNHFPAVSPEGDLYFVSDLTGVDNLYRYRPLKTPEMVTNLTTGLAFPSFGPARDQIYGSVFSYRGFDLAKLTLAEQGVPTDSVTVAPPPAPVADAASVPDSPESQRVYQVQDYSITPSIWPREWIPTLFLSGSGLYLGGQLYGYDAVDRHEYLLALGYDTEVQKLDWLASYTNRSLGPTLTLQASDQTLAVYRSADALLGYQRQTKFSLLTSYSIAWTYSSLTPALGLNLARSFLYEPGANPADNDIIDRSPYIPSVDLSFAYTNAESSRMAIGPEEGRYSAVGAREYFNGDASVTKGLLSDAEFIELGRHVVLSPSVHASWVSRPSLYGPANVVLQGRFPRVLNSFSASNFDQLAIRGYPNETFYTRGASVFALDLRFPLLRIFRGSGTNPAFFENLYGNTFAEATYIPGELSATLPAAGAGLTLTGHALLEIPLTMTLAYHYGFRAEAGGTGELFFEVGAPPFQF